MHQLLQKVLLTLAAVLISETSANAQQSATQVIDLQPGWNLISIQVGGPITPAFFKGRLDNPATTTVDESQRLKEVWSYQPSANPSVPGSWQTYQNPAYAADFQSDLTTMQPGQGYWVNVSQLAQATLTGARWDGALSLQTGWNLVGFPGLDLSANEANDLASVFGTSFSRVNQVWTFDTSIQRFSGYDLTAVPALKDLNAIRPAHGYWVYALEPFVITPQPYVALPGDADASPLEPEVPFSAVDFPGLTNAVPYAGTQIRKVRPSSEDVAYDLNGNKIIDTPFTQDTLLFEVGVNQKVITIGNTGGGLATWTVQNTISWLTTNPNPAAGVVTTDRDTVSLTVNRTGMSPGRQSGQFTIYLGGQVKVITVLVDVPTAAGDWKGLATTQRVNGKNIPIGAVDMGLNFFMASTADSETRFTGVLNQDTSLLFPRDVFMNGVFYSGDNFSLTTNFQMDAGDRNSPPFDSFPAARASGTAAPAAGDANSTLTNSATAKGDRDTNGDGKLDVQNPFPFAIHRQVTLLGQRINPNHLEGSYIESISGMLPQNQPIFIEGTFFLDRQTLTPTKKSIFNGTTTNPPITIGGTTGQLFRESTLSVLSPVTISGVTVTLNVTFPDPTKLTVSLIGPNNQTVNLSAHASTLGTTYTLSNFTGLSGAGAWKLRITWDSTSLRGTFTDWSLNVQGLATYSATGLVKSDVASGSQALAGAHAILTGSNVLQQADTAPFVLSTGTTSGSTTATLASTASLYPGMPISGNAAIPANTTITSVNTATSITLSLAATSTTSAATTYGTPGVFKFSGLTENQYTVTLTKPGYSSRSIAFYLNNANYYLGHGAGLGAATTDMNTLTNDPVILTQASGSTLLTAAPYIGSAPLTVNYSLNIPLAVFNGLGSNVAATWNFGDAADKDDETAITTAKHTYRTAGDYSASVTLTGSTTSITVPVTTPIGAVHVQRVAPDPSGPSTQITGVGFIGSFAAPLDPSVNANPIEKQPSSPVVYQESKRDSASFDIDREPLLPFPSTTPFHPGLEDSDYGDANSLMLVSGNNTATFPFLARIYSGITVTADERQLFLGDLSLGTFAYYPPGNPPAATPPERYRIFCTIGGYVFGEKTSLVGDYLLQAGRIDPEP